MPGISFLFIMPATIGVVGLLVLKLFRFKACCVQAFIIIFALSAAICFMPVAYILEIMIGYHLSVAISLMLGFIICALLPLLAVSSNANTPLLKLNITMGFITMSAMAWTIWQAPYTSESPLGLNIRYLQNSDDTAFILAGNQNILLPKPLLAALGDTQLAAKIPWSNTHYHVKDTPSLDVLASKLSRVNSEVSAAGRKLSFTLHSTDKQLRDVRLFIPVDTGLDTITTDDGIYQYKNKRESVNGFYELHCRGLSCAEINITLSVSQQAPIKLIVAKIIQGLPTNIKGFAQQRGSTAVEVGSGDQSIILSAFLL
jgi:hypothetical protein